MPFSAVYRRLLPHYHYYIPSISALLMLFPAIILVGCSLLTPGFVEDQTTTYRHLTIALFAWEIIGIPFIRRCKNLTHHAWLLAVFVLPAFIWVYTGRMLFFMLK